MTDRWGSEIREELVDGHPMRLFHPRPEHLREVFVEGAVWGDRAHLVQGDLTLSFADVAQCASNAAARLVEAGLRPGGRVMLLGHGAPEWVVGFWSIIIAGGVATLGNAWWSEDELTHALEVSIPDLILADDGIADRLGANDKVRAWSQFLDLSADDAGTGSDVTVRSMSGDESDPAVVLFTSGTTGRAKGAVLSHRALIAALHSTLYVTRRLPFERGTMPPSAGLSTGPLFHIGGIYALLQAVLFGRTLVFLRGRFDAGEVLDTIESLRIERWPAVPTMVQRVLDHPSLPERDVSSVKSLAVGGSALPTGLLDRVLDAFPNAARHVAQVYGLTEAGGTLTSTSARDDAGSQPGLVGRPMPLVELRIDAADESGIGEIVARSATQMSGYLESDDSDVLGADGWLRTGDLGRLDDGRLFLVGRSKDLIIRGGENIAAVHVERVLGGCEGVVEVAVVGLPHADLGEEVAAVVVPNGAEDPTDDLIAYAKRHLAYFERPSRWLVRRQHLPTNSVGKIDKRMLVEEWMAMTAEDRGNE